MKFILDPVYPVCGLIHLEQERNGYPNAGEIKKNIEERLAERKAQEQAMAQAQMGGEENVMPGM